MTAQMTKASEIERYTFHERICHWSTGLSYLYCALTGLAFYTPHLFWIAFALGGAPTSRFWHPIMGVAFCGCAFWMHAIWRRDMSITENDRRWMNDVKNYIENRDGLMPPQGRFNAGQKLFYWVMFYAAFFLLITGISMWFPEYMPIWLRAPMIVLHECAALLTIGAFLIHVYMGVFMVPGGLRAMCFGYVTRGWAKANHLLWYRSVTGDSER
jgi:formate dehydrogenase subunit gamma